SLKGEAPQVICDLGPNNMSGSWASSGMILFTSDESIYRVPAAGGQPVRVTEVDHARGELYHAMPYFLPDERHFLFLAVNQRTEDSVIYEAAIDRPGAQRILANSVGPFYVIGDKLIFVRDSTLMAQPFDWKARRLKGEAVSLHEQVYAYRGSFSPVAEF